jgi:hypothetical protein
MFVISPSFTLIGAGSSIIFGWLALRLTDQGYRIAGLAWAVPGALSPGHLGLRDTGLRKLSH